MAGKIKITLVRSTIRQKRDVKATVRTLGLKRLNSSVIHDDNPTIRGMVRRCFHILKVEEVQ